MHEEFSTFILLGVYDEKMFCLSLVIASTIALTACGNSGGIDVSGTKTATPLIQNSDQQDISEANLNGYIAGLPSNSTVYINKI